MLSRFTMAMTAGGLLVALRSPCARAPNVTAPVVYAEHAAASAGASAAASTRPAAGTSSSSPTNRTNDDASSDCSAAMFMDQKPGAFGLYLFEDGSSGLYGYASARGATLIPARFRFAYEFTQEGIAGAIDGSGRAVFIDTTGAVLAEAFLFDNGPDYFTSGRARIVDGGKVGFMDMRGRVVVRPQWDGATTYCHGHAIVCDGCTRGRGDDFDTFAGGKWGAIDRAGHIVVPLVHPSGEEVAKSAQWPK